MPIQYKVTFLFRICECGWSETIYNNAADRAEIENRVNSLAGARSQLLGQPATLFAARITDLASPRACALFPLGPFHPILPIADEECASWAVSLHADATPTTNTHCRTYHLSGIPDEWVERIVGNLCEWNQPEALTTPFGQWKTLLIDDHWQIKGVKLTGPGTSPINVTAIAEDPDTGYVKLLFPSAPDVSSGKIRLTGFTGPDANLLNGLQTVVSASGVTVVIKVPWNRLLDPASDINGKGKPQIVEYGNITGALLTRPACRKIGRPFGACRGRRRRRR